MTVLQCDICGGKLIMQSGGMSKCDACGLEYSQERLKELIQVIKGSVAIEGAVETVIGEAEKERLIKNAETNVSLGEYTKAVKLFQRVTEEYPDDYRGWWGLFKVPLMALNFSESFYINETHAKHAFSLSHSNSELVKEYNNLWLNYCENFISGRTRETKLLYNLFGSSKSGKEAISHIRCREDEISHYLIPVIDIGFNNAQYVNDSNEKLSLFNRIYYNSASERYNIIFVIGNFLIYEDPALHGYPENLCEVYLNRAFLIDDFKNEYQKLQWRWIGLCENCGGQVKLFGRQCKSCGHRNN